MTMTMIMITVMTMTTIITTDFADSPGGGLMQDSGQQPSQLPEQVLPDLMPPDLVLLHQALDGVEAVLSLERQRLQLLIDRRRAPRSSETTSLHDSSGIDAVIRLRRAA